MSQQYMRKFNILCQTKSSKKLKNPRNCFSRKNPREPFDISFRLLLILYYYSLDYSLGFISSLHWKNSIRTVKNLRYTTLPNIRKHFKMFYKGSGGLKLMFFEAISAAQKSAEKHVLFILIVQLQCITMYSYIVYKM